MSCSSFLIDTMVAHDQSACYITELRSFDQGQGHIIIGQDELEQNKAMWWNLSLVNTQCNTSLQGIRKLNFFYMYCDLHVNL